MKLAFFEINNWEKAIIKKAFKGHTLHFFPSPITKESLDIIKECDAISIFIYSNLDKEVLKKLPKLKLICTRSTGFDHIDLKQCKKQKITVCNVPFYGENTVAEHTFALILSLSRNIHKSYIRTTKNNFSIEGLKGFDLKGKTLGVIGAGHIGLHVIKMAKGFDMNVITFDVNQNKFLAEVLGFKYASNLEELLEKSDIITIHTPYNKHTHHLINQNNICKIKKGALLINTARGGIIENEALIKALDQGIIKGAGLDVIEGEELIMEEKQLLSQKQRNEDLSKVVKDQILIHNENVVFTPHIAFYSEEALNRILETTIKNIDNYIQQSPENVVF